MFNDFVYKLLSFTAIGFELAAILLICLYGGNWLDKKLNMSPNFLILGIIIAMVASYLALKTHLKIISKKSGDDKKNSNN